MNILSLCFVVELGLIYGLAGLFWPQKLGPVFEILMYPWTATKRMIRFNSVTAIGLSLLLLAVLLGVHH